MSHQEHFFLEYMPAVFTSPQSTVRQFPVTVKMPPTSASERTMQAAGVQGSCWIEMKVLL